MHQCSQRSRKTPEIRGAHTLTLQPGGKGGGRRSKMRGSVGRSEGSPWGTDVGFFFPFLSSPQSLKIPISSLFQLQPGLLPGPPRTQDLQPRARAEAEPLPFAAGTEQGGHAKEGAQASHGRAAGSKDCRGDGKNRRPGMATFHIRIKIRLM